MVKIGDKEEQDKRDITIKDFGPIDHFLNAGAQELINKVGDYESYRFEKGGSNFLTLNLVSTKALNSTITTIVMTEDELPEKINRSNFSFCFKNNDASNKSVFICKVDENNNIIESKHYAHYTDFY